MARRKSNAPSPESVKALADSLSQGEQVTLCHLFLLDPASWVGATMRTIEAATYQRSLYYERKAGCAPDQIDPKGLLGNPNETDKEAKKRTGLKNPNAVKTARYKARRKLEKAAPPSVVIPIR